MVSNIFLLYVVLLLCCYDYLFCSARDTLTHADPVIDEESGTLVSAGEKFELGFFTPTPIGKSNSGGGADSRYVGIWYYKVTPRTVVWVANRDEPLPANSTGVLTIEGGNLLVLDNVTGERYWSTDIGTSSSSNMTVQIMESGNLVLMDYDQMAANILWQSFQNPTDTFIPGMLMDKNLQLTSWRDKDDPRPGNFNFKLDQSKNQYIVMNKSLPYWKSGEPDNRFSPYEVPPKVTGLLSYFSNSSSTDTSRPSINFTIVRPLDYNYARLVIDFTGELQFSTWNENKKEWFPSWSEPKDNCSKFNLCGSFGSCNNNNRPWLCKCLPGFKPRSPDNWNSEDFSGGCDRESSISDNNSTFLSLKMMKVGEAESPFDVGSETECRKECLKNPQCQAYSYAVLAEDRAQRGTNTTTSTSSKCWTWLEDLKNLVEEYDSGHNITVRVASSDIESTVRGCQPCGTTMIPYPLSTGRDCGDPMYFRFICNTLTGQVSFVGLNDTFRVISIEPSMQKFVLKWLPAKKVDECDSRYRAKTLELNASFPFKISSWGCDADLGDYYVVELGWKLPPEPACNTSADCKGWPNSTCKPARDGMKRCLCNKSFQWNVTYFNCTQGSLHEPSNSPSSSVLGEHSSRKVTFYLIIVAVLISMILLACVISIYIWRRKMTRKQDQISRAQFDSERRVKELIDTSEFNEEDEKGIDVPFFDLQSILEATDNFSDANKLGQGGYGPVYKGKFFGGQEIAVKRLSKVSGQGLQEFRNEVVLIAKLQHRNLVRLRGYCMKGEEKILLYEYMPNKSLDSFIFDHTQNVFLNWEMRFNIILGIARGLLYLHQDSRLRIIHRDLKTSNVLLDEEMNPKISDFGLARIVGGKETEANTNTVVGTYGYMSPEYALDGTFSVKSDVFSFGVVLLEIISGKKNAGFFQSKQTFSLLGYAWELWTGDKVLDLMDKNLEESCNRSEFVRCVNVGLLCVQEDPVDRPTMSNVITLLDSETAIPATPKQPAFFIRRGNSSTASSSTKPETVSEITALEGR
ncbi:G-type lectin S-receptor-like serine/threonine-protein kinase At4g03230 isoform X2 [Rosa chinensis]|uniref:G-type lectin S-receptor-like serine/threonine-protein kinase At4g03230 isoform X2 n=1 Tax=Rosa chinensis TaxID=74649 RepID=UPI000D08699F|nr:G-type lectin S-receptor-like serine/threonine-protein kinase At4g03230 isoform X2 [Rosa chinensis]